MNIAVVIPTFNERGNIAPLLERLAGVLTPLAADFRLWVVDDESPDGTAEVVAGLQQGFRGRLRLVSAPRRGLGAALARGFAHALQGRPDIVVQMDADLSHAPEDIPALVQAIAAGADLAIGSRAVAGGATHDQRSWPRKLLSAGATGVARHWLGLRGIGDCTNGFRAWRAASLDGLACHAIGIRGYAFQVAALRRAVGAGLRIAEVPVNFPRRRHGRSKLRWIDLAEFARWAALNGAVFGQRP